ncbi:MAG TPA: hypothetical protein VLU99_05725, partial [Nitrososphaerales archaeon]|nr:hypothetical protein [Nitrososphaerales archaeon]
MSPEAAEYVAAFLTDSLGLAQGALPPGQVPSDLAELLVAALSGREDSASDQPILEQKIQAFLGQFEEATLDRRGYLLRKARWPGGASYAACLTHDVDNLSRPMGHIVKIRGRFSAADFWLSLLGLRSLYDNLAYTAALEESRNLRSSFYFLSSNYDLSKISARVRRLSEGGWDMGLHGDFGTHDSAEKMAAAVAAFKEKTGLTPRGLREHFLQFDYAKTWGIIDAQGFEYDTSVGNRDRLGFRLGLCTPFHPPD